MTRFDTYADKGRGKKMDTTPIAEFVCWTGLGIARGYSYFVSSYKGQYEVPQKKSVWARFDSYKKADPDASKDGGMELKFAADFEKRINSRI